MTEPRPTLLLTRPEAASKAFLSELRADTGADISAVISPILKIVACGPLPDLDGYATILLTSGHAVARLGRAGLLEGRNVATIGERAALGARVFGAHAEALGEDAAEFLAMADQLVAPCLHCRGTHTRGEIAGTLTARGIRTDEAVIYDQVAEPLGADALALLESGAPVVAPVFSPRSARLLSDEVPPAANPVVIAISPAAADAWDAPGRISVAKAPTREAMIRAVAAAI